MFPEVFESYLSSSIIGKSREKGIYDYRIINLCDFSERRTRRVDDRPYGGMPGTILSPGPLYNAISGIKSDSKDAKVIFLSARGRKLTQPKLEAFSRHSGDYILVCGHYEGIDQRVIDFFGGQELSIGGYVLTSGELAALVLLDGIVRLLPGSLKAASLNEESYSLGLGRNREYPQFTRPYEFRGMKVPEELVSGDPKRIEEWKRNFNK